MANHYRVNDLLGRSKEVLSPHAKRPNYEKDAVPKTPGRAKPSQSKPKCSEDNPSASV